MALLAKWCAGHIIIGGNYYHEALTMPDFPAAANTDNLGRDMNLVVGVAAPPGEGAVTARKAGGLQDLRLEVSPSRTPVKRALQNLAQAINIAFQPDFLDNELERVYKAARVKKGVVEILHKDYIGLGDGVFAKVGKAARSFQLTLRGPDPASPEGKEWIDRHGRGSVYGIVNFMGRKLDLIQEFEDKVPIYVEQMLDRLQAANMITGWDRSEWEIATQGMGLDVMLKPVMADDTRPT